MLSADYMCMPLTFRHLLHAPFSNNYDAIFLAAEAETFVLRARLLIGLVSAAACPPIPFGKDGSRPGARHLDVPFRQRDIAAGA